MSDPQTCPRCDALIVPQLVRCRRCGKYLHGTEIESLFFEHLPGPLKRSPGTGAIVLSIVLYYVVMVGVAGFGSTISFTSYSLIELGATHGPSILLGDWWRFITSIFVHHDLVHLAFNLYALIIVGGLVESLFDKKKTILMYLLTGVGSMIISHLWYAEIMGGSRLGVVSGGASGAVSGMVGVAWVGAYRLGPRGRSIVSATRRWTVYLAVWGFFVPGINNAAHAGGFVIGAGLGALVPLGLTKTVRSNRMLSVAMLGAIVGVLACVGLMLAGARGFPGSLDRDAEPSWILGIQVQAGEPFASSDQTRIWDECRQAVMSQQELDVQWRRCELNRRVNHYDAGSYANLAVVETLRGNEERAQTLLRIVKRLSSTRDAASGDE